MQGRWRGRRRGRWRGRGVGGGRGSSWGSGHWKLARRQCPCRPAPKGDDRLPRSAASFTASVSAELSRESRMVLSIHLSGLIFYASPPPPPAPPPPPPFTAPGPCVMYRIVIYHKSVIKQPVLPNLPSLVLTPFKTWLCCFARINMSRYCSTVDCTTSCLCIWPSHIFFIFSSIYNVFIVSWGPRLR